MRSAQREVCCMDQTLAEIAKSSVERIRVAIREYEGRRFVDVRLYFRPEGDGADWLPTRKGVTFSKPEDVHAVIAALAEARELLEGRPRG
jgi:hypothetical protein